MQPSFSIKEALSFGWKKFVENLAFLILLTLGFFIVNGVLDKMGGSREMISVYKILNIFVSYFAMFTFVRIGLKIYKGEKPHVKDIFHFEWKLLGLYFVAAIISMVLTVIGFGLLVIPGIILMVRLGLFGFALVDLNLKPIEALKKSFALTRGRFWQLLGLTIVLAVINIAGALLLGIGLLVTAPVCLLATVFVYEKLKALPEIVSAKAQAPVPPTAA
jgi:uncharacterized membrane protein